MIKEWVEQTSVYPPAHLYAGMPQGKQEKQAVQVCEELYKFNFGNKRNPLGDLRAAWREVEVTAKVYNAPPHLPLREFYLDKIISEFLVAAQVAVGAMDDTFKKHQAVNEYYKTWRMSYQDIKKHALELKEQLS